MKTKAKTTPPLSPEINAEYLAALVPFMPPGWTVKADPRSNTPDLYHAETKTALYITGKKYGLPVGMLEISHHRPSGKNGQYVEVSILEDKVPGMPQYGQQWIKQHAQSIRVSASKTPEQIAKDITKRLVPEAVRVTALVLAKIAADDAYASNQLATLHRMHKVAQTEVLYQNEDKNRPFYDFSVWSTDKPKSRYVDVEVRGADCVYIKGSFSAADAEKVLAFLKSDILK